jgi:hypothetical protein
MQLRHISPRSIDWMDAMDEEAGGRGWERLAPEEQEKLLRDRQQSGERNGASVSGYGERRPAQPSGYFATASPSR